MSTEKPVRVQLSRKKGWRMPDNTMSVARPGRWGNPFRPPYMPIEMAVELFRDTCKGFWSPGKLKHLTDSDYSAVYDSRTEWLRRLGASPRDAAKLELAGINLACWCPLDQPCHADVLLELANGGNHVDQ